MRVIVRADSNKIIAMGHVMRCLSIADALTQKGAEVIFVSASEDSKELIHTRGYRVEILDSDYSTMVLELDKFLPVINGFRPDVIIIDSYFVTDEYLNKLRPYAKLVYVDDYGTEPFEVDALINYNAYGEYLPYEKMYLKAGRKLPKLILGTAYAPLRKEFQTKAADIKSHKEQIISDAFEVLLSTGGADATHVALTLAKRFNKEIEAGKLEGVRLNILIGPFSADRDAVMDESVKNPGRINIFSGITDMPGFLSRMDIALSAAGSTTYELCSMGIPSILFCTADNQRQIHDAFKRNGLMKTAGFTDKDMAAVMDSLIGFIETMQSDSKLREEYSLKAKSVTDAMGAIRIADIISNI